MTNNYFTLYSSCKSVKGKERGAFYILDEHRIEIVPLPLIDVVDLLKIYSIQECRKMVDSENILDDYIDFLISKNIGFLTNEPDRFISMDDIYESPSFIFLSCISVDEKSTYDLKSFVQELDNLLCKHVELRMLHSNLTLKQLSDILFFFEGTTIRSIELYIKNVDLSEIERIKTLISLNKKISYTVVFDFEIEKNEDKIIFTNKKYIDVLYSSLAERKLYVNTKFYFEALKHNVFYNKKVSIDENGYLRNNLISKTEFGIYNVTKNPINKLIENRKFTKYWKISPDEIENLKDSELRYAIFPEYEIKELNGKFYFKEN